MEVVEVDEDPVDEAQDVGLDEDRVTVDVDGDQMGGGGGEGPDAVQVRVGNEADAARLLDETGGHYVSEH